MTVNDLLNYHKVRFICELCELYGISKPTIYKWSSEGIPYSRQKKISKASKGLLKVQVSSKN